MTRNSGNIVKQNRYWCPVCGYPLLKVNPYRNMPPPPWAQHEDPPYEFRYGQASYEICECCGFEFGNDDNPGTSSAETFEQYRRQWISDGAQWFSPEKRPANWDLTHQLLEIGIASPIVEKQS
jgi:hypothetical protein